MAYVFDTESSGGSYQSEGSGIAWDDSNISWDDSSYGWCGSIYQNDTEASSSSYTFDTEA